MKKKKFYILESKRNQFRKLFEDLEKEEIILDEIKNKKLMGKFDFIEIQRNYREKLTMKQFSKSLNLIKLWFI